MRVVFDTNILVKAILSNNSYSRLAYDFALNKGEIFYSFQTLQELIQVLNRKKLKKFITSKMRDTFLVEFITFNRHIEVNLKVNVCRDEDDNKFLELGLTSNINYLITDDEDLLVLNPFEEIQIIKPERFLAIIEN